MLLLNIAEYDSAAIRFIGDIISGFLDVDPLFSGIDRETSLHKGPIRNVPGDTPLDQEMFPVSGEGLLSWDSIRDSKIEDYTQFLVEISESQRKSLAKMFFGHLSEVTDATGMTISAGGKPLTADLILDLLEKVEFGFDDAGNPKYPTLIVPPGVIERLKKVGMTPEQEKRRKQIIEDQRARYNANKRTRRLS